MTTLLAVATLLGQSPSGSLPLPTAEEAIRRCQKAYDSVQTFEEEIAGRDPSGFRGTAHILFVRPGKFRVTGAFGDKSPYDLIVDGGSTWISCDTGEGKVKDREDAFRAVGPPSEMAAEIVPSMLLHFGYWQFNPVVVGGSGWTVAADSGGGRKLLRLHGTIPSNITLWLDAKTYFLVQSKASDAGSLVTVTYAPPIVDKPIPDDRFKVPTGK